MDKEQKVLYEYLIEHVTDEETAKIIVSNGEAGYYYGIGGYVVIDEDEISEALEDDNKFVLTDERLPNSYLIGSIA